MKNTLLLTLTFVFSVSFSNIQAQTNHLPQKAKKGKCYVRCTAPATYDIETVYYPIYSGKPDQSVEVENVEILTKPKTSKWEYRYNKDNCKSPDPEDCMVLCYVEVPAEYKYLTVVKDTSTTDQFEMLGVAIKTMEDAGGEASWEEVDCYLTDYSVLPIKFTEEKSNLNEEAISVIEEKILALMDDKTKIRVEVAVLSNGNNQTDIDKELAQSRTDAIIEYLISKEIQEVRLVSRGFVNATLPKKRKSKRENRTGDGLLPIAFKVLSD